MFFEASVENQLYCGLQIEIRLMSILRNVDMDRSVIVRIELEAKTIKMVGMQR